MSSRTEAEETAGQAREDLGIGLFGRLDPVWLLQQLEIPVLTLSDLAVMNLDPGLAAAVRLLLIEQPSALSAATVFMGRERLIVHNDAHVPERVSSNLSHEAAHALLLHAPRPAVNESGCRDWQDEVEKEAAYLGGCLLIPGKAARAAARKGWADGRVADQYGVSEWMARYRMNVSGARRVRT